MEKLKYILGGLFGLFLLGSPKAAKAEEVLYGETERTKYVLEHGYEEKKLRTVKDYLQFGEKLQKKSQREDGPYQECLEDKALEYLEKSSLIEAYPSIVEIHQDDIKDFPKDKRKYQEELVETYEEWTRKLYRDKEEKTKRQQELVGEYFNLASMLEQENEFGKAVDILTKARKLARALKVSKETQKQIQEKYDVNNEAARRQRFILNIKRTADENPENKQANFQVGEYYFGLGDFEKARQYLENAGELGSSYTGLLNKMKLVEQDGQLESKNGLSEDDTGKLRHATRKKDEKTIESLLSKFEVEHSLWYNIRKVSDKLGTEEAHPLLKELKQKADDLVDFGTKRNVPGKTYLELGDAFVSLFEKQKGKREQVVSVQNALMYYDAAMKKLDENSDGFRRAKELSEGLEKKLAELGGSKRTIDVAVAVAEKGLMWHFDTDENCRDFCRHWYTHENKNKPGFGWVRKGEGWYVCDGWEVRNGLLIGTNSDLICQIKDSSLNFSLNLTFLKSRLVGLGIRDQNRNGFDINLYEDLDNRENLFVYEIASTDRPKEILKEKRGKINLNKQYEIKMKIEKGNIYYKIEDSETINIEYKQEISFLYIHTKENSRCSFNNLKLK